MLDQPGKQPLTDPIVEEFLIAKLLAEDGAIHRIGILTANHMTDPTTAATLHACINLASDNHPINMVSLKPILESIRVDADHSAFDVLNAKRWQKFSKDTLAADSYSIEAMSKRLIQLAERRKLSAHLHAAAAYVDDEANPASPIAAHVISQCNDFMSGAVNDRVTTFELHEAGERYLDHLQNGKVEIEITSGLKDYDAATGGFHRGQFVILAGRPSMGKTCLAESIFLRTSLSGHGVYYQSLEMTEEQVVQRALTDFAYTRPTIAYSSLRPGAVTDSELRRLREANERFRDLPLITDTKRGLTVGEITARVRKAKEDFERRGIPLSLVVVDHLGKVRPSDRYAGQPVKELDEISDGMCALASSLNVAVLGLHQLNRAVESRDNQRPIMSDLRGSGSLEQDADVVLFVYRPAYRYERQLEDPDNRAEAEIKASALKHDLEVQIAKQRNGPTQSLEFYCDMAANVVRDKSWLHT